MGLARPCAISGPAVSGSLCQIRHTRGVPVNSLISATRRPRVPLPGGTIGDHSRTLKAFREDLDPGQRPRPVRPVRAYRTTTTPTGHELVNL